MFNNVYALFPFLIININKYNAIDEDEGLLVGLIFWFIRICFCVCGPAKVHTKWICNVSSIMFRLVRARILAADWGVECIDV